MNYESGLPGFWDDQERAQKTIKERGALESDLGEYDACSRLLSDARILMEMAEEAEDEDSAKEALQTFEAFREKAEEVNIRALLSDEYDPNNALVNIHPGAGGVDAQDWAEMLLRMYTRWAEKKGYKVKILDYQNDTEGGIKNVEILVEGPLAYGYLKTESGVHRLVRISPFDANARRHTSFSSLDVAPILEEDNGEIEVDMKYVRVDTYHSSGAGGQNVNKTSSAVRMTYVKDDVTIVVACQTERDQVQNRATCLKMLKAKLLELREREKEQQMADIKGEMKKIEWGSQIRSYVFQPYTMVKDHRTNYESGNIDDVMNGNLEGFVTAYLKMQ